MQSMPLISVIVPVYNAEQHLPQCLDSLLKQTYSNIEVICIDDKSSDNSWISLSQYAQVDSRIIPIQLETNSGAGVVRDLGIQIANGNFLMFVDSDDYIENDCIETFVNAITKNTDIVIGDYFLNKNNKQKLIKTPDNYQSAWLRTSPCIRLYKKDFLCKNDISFRKSRYYEDIVFNYRCMINNPNIKNRTYAGYHYVFNASSITQRTYNTLINFEENVYNHSNFWNEIKNKNISEETLEILEYLFVQNITIGMLYNLKRSIHQDYKSFLKLRNDLLKSSFPNYRNNKYIGIKKITGEYPNIELALSLYCKLEKVGLDRLTLWLLEKI